MENQTENSSETVARKPVILPVLALFMLCFICSCIVVMFMGSGLIQSSNRWEIVGTVKEKDNPGGEGAVPYVVVYVDQNGDGVEEVMTLHNSPVPSMGKMDYLNLQGSLNVGETYRFQVVGWNAPPFAYPIIISAVPIE